MLARFAALIVAAFWTIFTGLAFWAAGPASIERPVSTLQVVVLGMILATIVLLSHYAFRRK